MPVILYMVDGYVIISMMTPDDLVTERGQAIRQ